MRALILRTFSHNRIWEADKIECTFGFLSFVDQIKLIRDIEPNILQYLVSDFDFAVGIYISKYFTYKNVWSKTPEEESISLMSLRGTANGTFARLTTDNQLQISYNFKKKIPGSRNQMFLLDSKLTTLKSTLENPNSLKFKYFPLCFSLDATLVIDEMENIYGKEFQA